MSEIYLLNSDSLERLGIRARRVPLGGGWFQEDVQMAV